jgi:glycosyltransferase involved in cell wall biosynthesis
MTATAAHPPFVSVILCTYNGEKYLRQQVESILKQSYKNFELIISDDLSTDNTRTLLTQLQKEDQRIRLHFNAMNFGYNQNFARAFALASGEYIAVSDQDDIWKPEKLSELMPLFNSPDVMLVHAQSVRFSGEPPEIEHYTARKPLEGNDVKQALFFNTIAGHNMVFRKSLLQSAAPFPPDVFYDWWLAIHALLKGRIGTTTKVLGFHRSHESNVTLGKKNEGRQTEEKAFERLRTLTELINRKLLVGADEEFAKRLQLSLQDLVGKRFSRKLFSFLFRHAKTIFFFKKKNWPSVSHLKIAFRHSFAIK